MLFKYFIIILAFNFIGSNVLLANTDSTKINAVTFHDKTAQKEAVIIDVRTAPEFEKSHLANALNYNWNNKETFKEQINALKKDADIYVYCLSGGRSSAAAEYMRKNGFANVYELEGGLLKWLEQKLPVTESENNKSNNRYISIAAYSNIVNSSSKLVLVDFYADWCGPCKVMAPILASVSQKQSDLVQLLKVDADANTRLCETLGVYAIPDMRLYKNGKIVWQTAGTISQKKLQKLIKKHSK